jgi:bifunctional non-homologous end joining protein LigD
VELPFRDLRMAALLLRELLAAHGLRSWVKTSGGDGLHVLVPLLANDPFDRALAFASAIAREAVAREPKLLTLDMRRNRRRDRILVDIHRNPRGATLASAYSVRMRTGAPVSMPLDWSDVERDIHPEDFHLGNAEQRVRTVGDPFAHYLQWPQALEPLSAASKRPGRKREDEHGGES